MVRNGEVLGRAGWLAALLLVLGVAAASPARAETLVGLPEGEITGDWVGLIPCQVSLHEITLAISSSGPGTVKATVNVSKELVAGFSATFPISIEMTGEYDERTGYLDLVQHVGRHRTVNQMTGVVDGGSGRLVAWPEIPRILRSGCGPAVVGRADFRAEVQRVENSGKRWPKDMKKYDKAFQKARRKYKPEKLCNAQVSGWLEQFGTAPTAWPQFGAFGNLASTVHLALHDSGFRPHFGKGFAELSPKELGILVARADACRSLKIGSMRGWSATDLLRSVGRNRGGMPRSVQLAQNLVLDAEFGWQKRARARLEEIPRAGGREDEIDAIESAGERVKDHLWPDDRKALEAAVTTARTGWARGALVAALAPLIEAAPRSVAAAERLAAYTRENAAYGKLNAADRAEIDALVKRSVDASVVPAAERFAAEASGAEGAREMANWRLLHPVLWETMDPALRLPVRQAFEGRFSALVEALVADERREYEDAWALRDTPLEYLGFAVRFEQDFTKRYELANERLGWLSLPSEPSYRAFAADRAERRRKALAQAREELGTTVAGIERVRKLDDLEDAYLLPADRGTPDGVVLAAVISGRREALTPFRSYRGGAYLDALYQDDRATLEEMDDAFRDPYVRLVQGMTSAVASPYFSMTMGPMMRAAADSISLIGPVIASYLLNYPSVYARCMEPDADTVERRISREWVTKDLFGNRVGSTRLPDIVNEYKVNKRFTKVFMQINADYAPGAGLIDLLMKSAGVTHGAIGTADVGLGVSRMMRDFPCDGPVIARFEKNMLRYFYE